MVSKNWYKVWPAPGQGMDCAEIVFAPSEVEAVQQWAREMDTVNGIFDEWLSLRVHVKRDSRECLRKTYTVHRKIEKFYTVVED